LPFGSEPDKCDSLNGSLLKEISRLECTNVHGEFLKGLLDLTKILYSEKSGIDLSNGKSKIIITEARELLLAI